MNKLEQILASVLIAGTCAAGTTNTVPITAYALVDKDAKVTFKTEKDTKTYRMQRCTNLTENAWVNVGGYVKGTLNKVDTYTFYDKGTVTNRPTAFYRIIKY